MFKGASMGLKWLQGTLDIKSWGVQGTLVLVCVKMRLQKICRISANIPVEGKKRIPKRYNSYFTNISRNLERLQKRVAKKICKKFANELQSL